MSSPRSEIPLPDKVVRWGHAQLHLMGEHHVCRQDLINFLVGRIVRGYFQAIENFSNGPMTVRHYRQKDCPNCRGKGWDPTEPRPCVCSYMRIEPDYAARRMLGKLEEAGVKIDRR